MNTLIATICFALGSFISAAHYAPLESEYNVFNEVTQLQRYCDNHELDKVHTFYSEFKKLDHQDKLRVVQSLDDMDGLCAAYYAAYNLQEKNMWKKDKIVAATLGTIGVEFVMNAGVCATQALSVCLEDSLLFMGAIELTAVGGALAIIMKKAWFNYTHPGFKMIRDFEAIKKDSSLV